MMVDVLDIDIGALRDWIVSGPPNRNVETFYVTFHGSPVVDPSGDGTFAIVRLKNGSELHGPFTVATDHSIYIQGDYNSVNWVRSAVVE